MPNWASGDMIVQGNRDNILSFLRHGFNGGILLEDWKPDGSYCEFTFSHHCPHMKETGRCYCGENYAELDGDLGRIYMECAWDIDNEGLKKASGKYHIKLDLEVEEGGMGFCHRYICENGEEIEDTYWGIRWDENRKEYVVCDEV